MENISEYLIVRGQEYKHPKNAMIHMVQNEDDKNAAYETYDFSEMTDKYKKGFVCISKMGDNSIVIEAINSGKDLANLVLGDDHAYDYLDQIELFHKYETNDEIIIRIW